MPRENSNNGNWKGGITFIRNADQLLGEFKHLKEEFRKRMFDRINKNGPVILRRLGKCWLWTGGTYQSNGRPRYQLGPAQVMYVLYYEKQIGKLCVCHSCDNILCVNPKHLWLGTHQQNSDDMIRKGRQATGDRNGSRLHPERLVRGDAHLNRIDPARVQGENNPRALLTNEQVREIKSRYKPYVNNHDPSNAKELALEFGVAKHVIICIGRGITWKTIT